MTFRMKTSVKLQITVEIQMDKPPDRGASQKTPMLHKKIVTSQFVKVSDKLFNVFEHTAKNCNVSPFQ